MSSSFISDRFAVAFFFNAIEIVRYIATTILLGFLNLNSQSRKAKLRAIIMKPKTRTGKDRARPGDILKTSMIRYPIAKKKKYGSKYN